MRGVAGPDAAAAARGLARRLGAYEEGEVRIRAAARALAALAPDTAADRLAALARGGGGAERAAWAAAATALARPDPELTYAWRAELYALATERGLLEIAGVLAAPPPARAYQPPRDRADPRLAHLTLGHKKAAARAQRDPDLLARLAAEGEPAVVRELLRNPRLTEDLVIRLAARRPIRPGTLRCLLEARRWRTRPAVALAIAQNPFVETAVAVELLPSLAAADLAELSRDGAVHPFVRAVAARLASARAAPREAARRAEPLRPGLGRGGGAAPLPRGVVSGASPVAGDGPAERVPERGDPRRGEHEDGDEHDDGEIGHGFFGREPRRRR